MATISIHTNCSLYHPRTVLFKTRFSCSNSRSYKLCPWETKFQSVISRLPSPQCSMQQSEESPPSQAKIIDLQLTIRRSVIISPMEITERKTCFLSNIDQRMNFMTQAISFFDNHPIFSFETVVTRLETSYKELLVHYDFMAGRLKWNAKACRQEIDCNSAGAGFQVACSDLRLEDLGDLVYPKLGYHQLAPRKLKGLHHGDQPLIIIQVTSFSCGGFAIGYSINHMALDGISTVTYIRNLASLTKNNGLELPICNDRQLLAARSPPHVQFLHPEYICPESIENGNANHMPLKATFQKLDCNVLKLSSSDINILNELAKMDNECPVRSLSPFNLVSAHIWRCVALARNSGDEPEKKSTLIYAVNIRPRVRPRFPTSYSGNGILNAYWTATRHELQQGPISRIVKMVSQAATRITDEYIKSTIDYGELHKKLIPYGDVQISSWLNHEINEIEFPWGKSKWTTPVLANHGNNAIILLPDIDRTSNGGINVLLTLPHKEMEKFQGLFYKF